MTKSKAVLLVASLLGFGSTPVYAANVTVNGGGSSEWYIYDSLITDNGLPSGGQCSDGGAGSGASISDAQIPAGGDAFDYGGMVWVDGNQLGGALSASGNRVTFAPQNFSGLNTQLTYDILTTSATLRVLLTLENPSGSPITVSVDYATNFGSDSSTTVRGTSSGDTTFTEADSWVVTSDSGDFDPVNNTVIFGAGAAPLMPSSVSGIVFNCAGPEGVLATYDSVTIPAGSTISMMFFQRMSDTTPNALSEATEFDDPTLSTDLLTGLSESELAQIQNFDLGALPPPPPPSSAVPVPTMSQWLVAILALFVALVALLSLRSRMTR